MNWIEGTYVRKITGAMVVLVNVVGTSANGENPSGTLKLEDASFVLVLEFSNEIEGVIWNDKFFAGDLVAKFGDRTERTFRSRSYVLAKAVVSHPIGSVSGAKRLEVSELLANLIAIAPPYDPNEPSAAYLSFEEVMKRKDVEIFAVLKLAARGIPSPEMPIKLRVETQEDK